MATTLRTEHPHIVRDPKVAGGDPTITGTRISVVFVVRQLRAGDRPEDILASYPHLTPAAVYDAISYYYDHQDEVAGELREQTSQEALRADLVQLDAEQGPHDGIRFRSRTAT